MSPLPKTTDLRVRRTDERLRAAFISLVHEIGFEAVTIRSVVQRARVGRSTFYTHFGDLDELHESWLREFSTKSRRQQPLLDFVRSFIQHAQSQKGKWHGLARKSRGAALVRRFRRTLVSLAKEELAQCPGHMDSLVLETKSCFLAGGVADVIFWWIDAPESTSAEKIEAAIEQLTSRVIGRIPHHGVQRLH